MAGCYFTLCRSWFSRKFSLLLLLAVFAYSNLERLLRLERGVVFLAYIQIHAMVMVLQIY